MNTHLQATPVQVGMTIILWLGALYLRYGEPFFGGDGYAGIVLANLIGFLLMEIALSGGHFVLLALWWTVVNASVGALTFFDVSWRDASTAEVTAFGMMLIMVWVTNYEKRRASAPAPKPEAPDAGMPEDPSSERTTDD